MRLKHVKGAEEIVACHPLVLSARPLRQNRGNGKCGNGSDADGLSSGADKSMEEVLGSCASARKFLEIGCGKGQFILNKALNDPSSNYVGVEMYSSVLLRALQRCDMLEEMINNLYFINDDALKLGELLDRETIDGIYLNFSDPWPKDRHSKRRLTSHRFLDSYKAYLKKGAFIEFKTDNFDLFDFSLEQIREHPDYELCAYTYDLYDNEEMLKGNIATEYEEKFISHGQKICKLIANYNG